MPITPVRAALLIIACSVAALGLGFAAAQKVQSESQTHEKPMTFPTKTVPDVVSQPYVFAESTLQVKGFGWQVTGSVAGWAGMLVASQSPAPGTVVIDTGTPLVLLRLTKPSGYVPSGKPENSSPYESTRLLLLNAPGGTSGTTSTNQTTTGGTTAKNNKPHGQKPVVTHPQRTVTQPTTTSSTGSRPPAFVIAGAPNEPLSEIPLTQRARELSSWLDSHRAPSAANERYWLYQHAWIVTGAKFGWWHGAAALRELIKVDKRVETLWGVGSQSEKDARAALAFVTIHSGR